VGIGGRIRRQILERRDNAEELVHRRVIAEGRLQRFSRRREYSRRLPRIYRQVLIEISERERVAIEFHSQLSPLEDVAILIAKDRQQQFRLERRLQRTPIDVE